MVSFTAFMRSSGRFVFSVNHLWTMTNSRPLGDFYILWAPAQYLKIHPQIDVYEPVYRQEIFEFIHHPAGRRRFGFSPCGR
jgi:hypothetical protein